MSVGEEDSLGTKYWRDYNKVPIFPGGSAGKEPTYQSRRHKRLGFNPWVWKIPWRTWQPTPVFLPGESYGQRSLVGYSPWCYKGSYMTD